MSIDYRRDNVPPESLEWPSSMHTTASSWAKRDLSEKDYFVRLQPVCGAEMRRVLTELRTHALPTVLLTPDEYRMPACLEAMTHVRKVLDEGRGFAIIDRIPIQEMAVEEAIAVFWLLSTMIARPVAQKVDGTMIYDVWDTGQKPVPGSGIRRDKTNSELTYHTDNSYNDSPPEYVGLLCLRSAKSGGLSRIISFQTIHNEIGRKDRSLLPRFYQPYWFDRQREHLPDEETTFSAPIFEYDGKQLRTRLSLHQIRGGYILKREPVDGPTEASLALLEEIFRDENLAIEINLQPGWVQYLNNRVVGHGRTLFEDFPEPERKRHLIRLWLRNSGRRGYRG
jgi:alpha-ketoglutarate-dependent taurine dioxygenase